MPHGKHLYLIMNIVNYYLRILNGKTVDKMGREKNAIEYKFHLKIVFFQAHISKIPLSQIYVPNLTHINVLYTPCGASDNCVRTLVSIYRMVKKKTLNTGIDIRK